MALPAEPYYYRSLRVWDPTLPGPLANAVIQFFATGDAGFVTPLEIWNEAGVSLGTQLTATAYADTIPYVLAQPEAVAKSGAWTTPVQSHSGLREAVEDARDAALAAQAAAEAVEGSASGIEGAPSVWPSTFPPSSHSHPAGDLRRTDGATLAAVILSLLGAADAQQARGAIGAGTGNGTSNLTLGTTADTAAPGNHLHSYYTTEERVLELIAANGGGGGGGNTVSVWYANGAWPALASAYPDGTTINAIGPTDPGYAIPTGVVGIVYIPRDV